jgi:CheY-like chemotaxis protein
MDIMMPVMNGIESTKAIRSSSHPDSKSVPIIAMTANAYKEDIEKTQNAGMNAHISKPIDTNILFGILSSFYHGSKP